MAFALLFGDVEFLLLFVLRMKAKYMVVIAGLIYLATLLIDHNGFGALLALVLRPERPAVRAYREGQARRPDRGCQRAVLHASQRLPRWKRRSAARKFEVYMRKQDRVVKFDDEGRYIAPEEEKRDPKDRKWMN